MSTAAGLLDDFLCLQGDAGRFGLVDRSVVRHPTGEPESDTDHTVSLLWFACAFVSKFYPGRMDLGLVAQFAAVHDAPELEAGDTPTLGISDAGRVAKRTREAAAAQVLTERYGNTLDWFPSTIALYEKQELGEARIVRALDKTVVKLASLATGCMDLMEHGYTSCGLKLFYDRQRAEMSSYAGDFPEVLDLYDAATERILLMMEEPERISAAAACAS